MRQEQQGTSDFRLRSQGSGSKTQTLPVAIFNFVSYAYVDWGGLMAAAVMITLPIMILSMCLQKYIVSGLTAGAVKG